MAGEGAAKSGFGTFFWLVLLAIGVLIFLQFAGITNVVGKSESESIIERPHDADRR